MVGHVTHHATRSNYEGFITRSVTRVATSHLTPWSIEKNSVSTNHLYVYDCKSEIVNHTPYNNSRGRISNHMVSTGGPIIFENTYSSISTLFVYTKRAAYHLNHCFEYLYWSRFIIHSLYEIIGLYHRNN